MRFKAQLKQAAEIAKQFRGSVGDFTPTEPKMEPSALEAGDIFAVVIIRK